MIARRCILILLSGLLVLSLRPAHAVEVAGVKVPETVRFAGQDLRLLGSGLRTRFFFKVYVASLYTPDRPASVTTLIDSGSPCVITLHLLRDVSANKLTDAMADGLRANTAAAELAPLRPGIEKLIAVMQEVGEAKTGTLVTLGFTPYSVNIAVNGTDRGRVAIPGLSRAMLRVWLGDHPVQESLKRALLGNN